MLKLFCFQMTSLQAQLKEQTDRCDSLSEQLSTAKARLQDLESQSEEKANTISSLTQEVERLRRELKVVAALLSLIDLLLMKLVC